MSSDGTTRRAGPWLLTVPAFWEESNRARGFGSWALLFAYFAAFRFLDSYVLLWLFAGPLLLGALWFVFTWKRERRVHVWVQDGVLQIERSEWDVVSLQSVDSGFVVREGDRATLKLLARNGMSWNLGKIAEKDAVRLLSELGLDAASRRVAVYGRDGAAPMVGAVLGLFAGALLACVPFGMFLGLLGPSAQWLVGILFSLCLLGGAVIGWKYGCCWQLEAGSDGVLLRREFASEFFPREELTSVHANRNALVLRFRSRDPVGIPFESLGIVPEEGASLAERLQQTLLTEHAPISAAMLARNGRSIASWREALQAALQSGSYREAAVDRKALLDILTNAAASVEARLGAALALSAQNDDTDARTQIRAVAETVVSPPVRAALVEIAAEEAPGETVNRAVESALK